MLDINPKGPKVVRQLNGHIGAVNAVRFTVDGSYCMTASDDRSLKLWNPHKPDPNNSSSALHIKTYSGVHGYGVLDVAISSDKTKFASAGEEKTCFWTDVASGNVLRRIQGHNHKVNSICLNPDSTVLITASYDQTLKCWDLKSNNREPIQVMSDFKDSVTCIALTDTSIIAGSVDGTVRHYDMRRGMAFVDTLHDPVTCLTVSEDQKCYLASCLNSTVKLMSIGNGALLKEYSGHEHSSFKTEARFEVDCQHILSGSEDGSVYRWSLITGAAERVLRRAHNKAVSSISQHPTLSMFLSASYDGSVKLWEN